MQLCLNALHSYAAYNMLPILLVISVIFLNGATDAPNTVAGAVSCGSLSYKRAVILCAVFNFLGMALSCMFFPAVAKSISSLAVGENNITAVLAAVVVFTAAAWLFGIPTSESHALIAALGGAELYFIGKSSSNFISVSLKSVLSCAVGVLLGAVFYILLKPLCFGHSSDSKGTNYSSAESICAAASSACHGMQDGQKFAAMLAALTVGGGAVSDSELSISAILICSAVMAAGSLCGGGRMIKKLGHELVKASCDDVISSDAAAAVCTLLSTFFGIPVSTTYMKTCSMLGAAAVCGKKVDRRILAQLAGTWILTYPACMALSYIFCMIFS